MIDRWLNLYSYRKIYVDDVSNVSTIIYKILDNSIRNYAI